MDVVYEFSKEYNRILNDDLKKYPNMIKDFANSAVGYDSFDEFIPDDSYMNWVHENIDDALQIVISKNPKQIFDAYYKDSYYDDFEDFINEYIDDHDYDFDGNEIENLLENRYDTTNMLMEYIHGTSEFQDELRSILYDTARVVFGNVLEF